MRISDWSSDVCSSDLDDFFAAGAPWFFTLFGRDSLWAARLVLPVDPAIAASTLRVLARLQGTVDDPATAARQGVMKGKSVSVRVDIGCRRNTKKKINVIIV